MATARTDTGMGTRESVPFRLRTADGDTVELTYSSPRPAADSRRGCSRRGTAPGSSRASRCGTGCSTRPTSTTRWSRSGADAGVPRGSAGCVRSSSRVRLRTRPVPSTRGNGSTTTRPAPGTPISAGSRHSSTSTTRPSSGTAFASTTSRLPSPRSAPYGYLKNLVTLAGGGLIVRGGAIIHRMGLGSWQRGREVIWSKALTALQVPIYLTIHGRGIGEPGAGRWLDSNTFVFNESVVANEEGLRQIEFTLNGLGVEMITTHSGLGGFDRRRQHRARRTPTCS